MAPAENRRAVRIGIDFDGTVALYGNVFRRYAVECMHLPADIPPDKGAIRQYLWTQPGGKTRWIELQGIVYGTGIRDAEVAPGLEHFLSICKSRQLPVRVISHKTRHPALGPKVDLHAAAEQWLRDRKLLEGPDELLNPSTVFWETTRAGKIDRIISERCTHFVDDLVEVFLEPSFPRHVQKMLYSPTSVESAVDDILILCHWQEIEKYFLNGAHADAGNT